MHNKFDRSKNKGQTGDPNAPNYIGPTNIGKAVLDHSPLYAALAIQTAGASEGLRNKLDAFGRWYNKGRKPNENQMSWRDLFIDDWKQRGKPGDGTGRGWDFTRGFRPGVSAAEGGMGSGPTPLIRQLPERTLGRLLTIRKRKEKK